MNAQTQTTSTARSLHTPGPWKAFKPLDSNGYVYVQSESGEEACTCYYSNAEANARLIAAAPELLDTLKTTRRVLEVACGTSAPYIREAFQRIDPVIAKAEGAICPRK